ncbi:hypothetical protein K457DRAFT_1876595 [Linnemannia elongata AG-77]|uniref:Uncharacterized protein n=1 Tax=Linnemannia elongata AG-77 TaxID=1314771 RepID=A0A197JTZ6_9FUNG|nr:hypothetical protein K457DRAFT_1876595 [Linnemannia elongata AG-77]
MRPAAPATTTASATTATSVTAATSATAAIMATATGKLLQLFLTEVRPCETPSLRPVQPD